MSTDNEANQIDVELALHDVMGNICKYVHGKDLLNMAKVCKSWNFASLREERKRYHIQQLRLLYNISKLTSALQFPYWINNLASVVHAKPEASLFIYEPKFEKICISFPCTLLKDLEKQLPNKTIVIGVDEYLTTEDIHFQGASIKGHCHLKRSNGDILGIFFPCGKPQIRVHVAWIEYDLHESGGLNRNVQLAKHLAENLRLNKCKYPKSTVLLLTHYFEQNHWLNVDTIIREFVKIIQKRGKEVTLASIHALLVTSRCNATKSDRNSFKPYVALRISGRTVESWSTFIPYRAQRDDIKCKLQALKEKVNKSKRYYTGLVWMPKCEILRCSHIEHPCGNSRMMMYSLKRIFPYIQFTGFFINRSKLYTNPPVHNHFPDVFNENDAYNPDFLDQMYLYVSIIIISYD